MTGDRRPTPGDETRDANAGRRTPDLGRRPRDLDSSTGLAPRTASALAYLAGPFSGALMLFAESRNDDVRFHAWQSIVGLGGVGIALALSYVLAVGALFVSAAAVSAMIAVSYVLWVVLLLVWAICLFKAYSGERWKLPLVGDYAERFSLKRGAGAAG